MRCSLKNPYRNFIFLFSWLFSDGSFALHKAFLIFGIAAPTGSPRIGGTVPRFRIDSVPAFSKVTVGVNDMRPVADFRLIDRHLLDLGGLAKAEQGTLLLIPVILASKRKASTSASLAVSVWTSPTFRIHSNCVPVIPSRKSARFRSRSG